MDDLLNVLRPVREERFTSVEVLRTKVGPTHRLVAQANGDLSAYRLPPASDGVLDWFRELGTPRPPPPEAVHLVDCRQFSFKDEFCFSSSERMLDFKIYWIVKLSVSDPVEFVRRYGASGTILDPFYEEFKQRIQNELGGYSSLRSMRQAQERLATLCGSARNTTAADCMLIHSISSNLSEGPETLKELTRLLQDERVRSTIENLRFYGEEWALGVLLEQPERAGQAESVRNTLQHRRENASSEFAAQLQLMYDNADRLSDGDDRRRRQILESWGLTERIEREIQRRETASATAAGLPPGVAPAQFLPPAEGTT